MVREHFPYPTDGPKILFDTSLNKKNLQFRDFLLTTLKKYKYPSSSIVLELGVGNGRFVLLLAGKFKEYWGVDKDEEYLNIARRNVSKFKNVHLKFGKAESVPFKKRFDIILCINSWHFTDNEKALMEIKKSI